MEILKKSLHFKTSDLEFIFQQRYRDLINNFKKMVYIPNQQMAKDFILSIKELGSMCLYPSKYPLPSYFDPNLDVYVIIGMRLLSDLFDTDEAKLNFINYVISLGYIHPAFSNLLLSAIYGELQDWKRAFLYAKQGNDSFSHCGAAYRTLHDIWEKCEQLNINTGATYCTDAFLADKFCALPFQELFIGFNGSDLVASPCHCPIWLSYGKRIKAIDIKNGKINNIWNSPELEILRTSILDGSFKYCSKVRCPLMKSLPKKERANIRKGVFNWATGPEKIILAIDNICNLKCKTCRSKKHKPGIILSDEYFEGILATIYSLVTPSLEWITASANGEVLASPYSLRLLRSLPFHKAPNLKIGLMTNGELLSTRWHRLEDAQERVKKLVISFHAITEETYELQRPGGSLKRFMKGIEFAADLKRRGQVDELVANVTVHADNMAEAPAIFKICQMLDFDICCMSKLENWGTFSVEEFRRLSIWNKNDLHYNSWRGIYDRIKEMSKKSATKLEFSNFLN